MKVILSRKGFDSGSGGIPSPILPDGTLLSLPIPAPDSNLTYDEIVCGGKTYKQIINELASKNSRIVETCHLDPDIRKDVRKNGIDNWKPAFGQMGAALKHLDNNNVEIGDIFLFFGWFKQAEMIDSKYVFKKGVPDIQMFYGYMQIGNILRNKEEIEEYSWHPHAHVEYSDKSVLYLPSEKLLDTDLPGYGVFSYSDELVLTKPGEPRSHWKLPDCLKGKDISYHHPEGQKESYFQSAMRGQEFVVRDTNKEVIDWVKSIIKRNYSC